MNILTVDDEALVLERLTRTIKEVVTDGTVHSFSRSDEALAFAMENSIDVAFLDIDMAEMNGIELAEQLKSIRRTINIIFVTGYSQYMADAFNLFASAYVMKPFTMDDIAKVTETENLRYPPAPKNRVRVQCFGNFEVYADGEMLKFPRSKSKELFAYLIHKNGTSCTVKELTATLFEDSDTNLQPYISAMRRVFEECGAADVIKKDYNSLAVDTDRVDCDLYRALNGDVSEGAAFIGEYMSRYAWGEEMAAYLAKSLN